MDVIKIGTFIKAQRTELNITQKDLAGKIGCTDKAISRWETGKGLPDMSFIIPLSKELNVSINELLIGEKIVTETSDFEASEISLGLLILLCLQMIIFFVIPNFVPDSFAPFEMMLTLSAIISVFVGLSKNKLKWLFPLAISLVFFFINLLYRTEEGFLGFVVSFYFATGSAIIIAISSLLAYLYQKFKCR